MKIKQIVIFCLVFFSLSFSSAKTLRGYYLTPELRQMRTAKMDELIKTIGFNGFYRLTPDNRIFLSMDGKIPKREFVDINEYKTYCDSLVAMMIKWYNLPDVKFELKSQVWLDTSNNRLIIKDGKEILEPVPRYTYRCNQTFNGNDLRVLDNREARSYILDPELKDSLPKYSFEVEDTTSWYLNNMPIGSIDCSFQMTYIPESGIYHITNNLFLQPVFLPEVKISKDEILDRFSKKDNAKAFIRKFGYRAIPKNGLRSAFDYKFIYDIKTGERYGGMYYYVDGTTGEILLQGKWME